MSGGDFEVQPGGFVSGAFHGLSLMIHGIKEVQIEHRNDKTLQISMIDKLENQGTIHLFLEPGPPKITWPKKVARGAKATIKKMRITRDDQEGKG